MTEAQIYEDTVTELHEIKTSVKDMSTALQDISTSLRQIKDFLIAQQL